MKTITTSNLRPLRCALCIGLIGIAALWAMPENARAQLYVSQIGVQSVGEYDATTGTPINANLIKPVFSPYGMAVSGNDLFVTVGGDTVGEYNATTGAAINASFITGLNGPAALVVVPVPEPSAWSMIAVGGVALLGMMLRKKHHTAY